jgi:hypothetical protein
MDSNVNAIALSGNDLYAGGRFTNADGNAANHVAKWNGSSWSTLGSGMNNTVNALAVSGSNLYAGGSFTNAGGIAANRIARWDGTAWNALGSGVSSTVLALAVAGSDLYAGGSFLAAGGSNSYFIAKWNGNAWSTLGSGMNGPGPILIVNALAVTGNDLYAGGLFTTAGGKVSAFAAKAILNPGSWQSIQYGVPNPQTSTLTFEGIPTNLYVAQFATNLVSSPWFNLATNVANAIGYGTVIDPNATDAQRFYRLLAP